MFVYISKIQTATTATTASSVAAAPDKSFENRNVLPNKLIRRLIRCTA